MLPYGLSPEQLQYVAQLAAAHQRRQRRLKVIGWIVGGAIGLTLSHFFPLF